MERRHTDSAYGADLSELRERLLMMGAHVEEMLRGALTAMRECDAAHAKRAIGIEHHIDELELDIDARCLRILARWNPVASDLRFVTAALKLVTHLERIGDLAESICGHVLVLLKQERTLSIGPALARLAHSATELVREALDAFVARDVRRAEAAVERDRMVDACYAQFFPELMQLMVSQPERVAAFTRLQVIGKHFERIGDEATNIAEMIPFMVEGKSIRHRASRLGSAA
jgi:phosphate transport system protein